MQLTIAVHVIDLQGVSGEKLAVCRLGGLTVRGRPAPDARSAVRNLLWRLAGQDDDDNAAIGLSLALGGQDINEIETPALDHGGT